MSSSKSLCHYVEPTAIKSNLLAGKFLNQNALKGLLFVMYRSYRTKHRAMKKRLKSVELISKRKNWLYQDKPKWLDSTDVKLATRWVVQEVLRIKFQLSKSLSAICPVRISNNRKKTKLIQLKKLRNLFCITWFLGDSVNGTELIKSHQLNPVAGENFNLTCGALLHKFKREISWWWTDSNGQTFRITSNNKPPG